MGRRELLIGPDDDSAVESFAAVRAQHAEGWIAPDQVAPRRSIPAGRRHG